jgi:hypothetical protein
MEKWFRRIWFVNGVLVLIGASLFIRQQVRTLFPQRSSIVERGPIVGEKLEKAIKDTLALQDISMSLPRKIGATPLRFIQLQSKDLTTPTRMSLMTISIASDTGPLPEPDYSYEYNAIEGSSTINIVFLKSDGSDAHLLLDKKGFVATADIPNERDTSQKYNIYRLVFEDTDNDGRLTRLDGFDLYLSDLFGGDLRHITDSTMRVTRYLKLIREKTILLLVKVRPDDPKTPVADWPEKIYVYDLKSNQLSPFFTDESLLKKARRMLWTK